MEAEWTRVKPAVKSPYWVQNIKLRDIVRIMRQEHSFDAESVCPYACTHNI
jgi:hypothetical protein